MQNEYQQWGRRGKIAVLTLAVFVSCVVMGGVKYLPIGEHPNFVVRVKDGLHNISLNSGEETKYEFTPKINKIKGITVYTDAGYFGKEIEARILDKTGRELTKSEKIKREYSDVRTTLTFYFPVVKTSKNENISVVIKNTGRQPISLWGRDLPGKKIVALSLLEPTLADHSLKVGVSIGTIFFLLLVVITLFFREKKRLIGIIILLTIVTPVALSGLLRMDKWGISDWDYYISVHSAYRQEILKNHVFPFWDPFTAGGTAGLADPEFPLFSPTFIPELIFGVPIGIRITVMISVVVGGLGMFLLARNLKLSSAAAALCAVGFMFGGVNLLEIIEGHVNIYMAMWIPWIIWSWLAMIRGKKKPLVCGIFLALTFYGGGIYLLMYTALAFIGLSFFTAKPFKIFLLTIKAGLWALGLSAFKLIPVFLWLKKYPDNVYASSTNTLPWLKQIFLERIPHGAEVIYGQGSGWHEYSAYLGPVVFILALVGLFCVRRDKMARVLFLSAVAAVLISASGPLLKPFFDVFPYVPRSNVSRFVLFAVIPILLMAGYGVDFIQKKIKFGEVIVVFLIGFVAIDLMSYSYIISRQAFVLEPLKLSQKANFPIEYTENGNYVNIVDVNGNEVKYSRSYASFLAGYGSTTFPSVLGPDARVKVIQDEKHQYVELENKRGSVKLIDWNPNKVTISVNAESEDLLIINANYADGWYANNKLAMDVGGRVAIRVQKGESTIIFQYKTPGAIMGAIITIATLLLMAYLIIFKRFDYGLNSKSKCNT
jgi:hypothetical protein